MPCEQVASHAKHDEKGHDRRLGSSQGHAAHCSDAPSLRAEKHDANGEQQAGDERHQKDGGHNAPRWVGKNATVIGQAWRDAMRFAPVESFCCRRKPWPAPAKECGSKLLPRERMAESAGGMVAP